MRGTRWVLLLAILAILGGTAFTYYAQRKASLSHATPKPREIGQGLSGSAEDWQYEITNAGKAVAKITAKGFTQETNSNHAKLVGVRMDLTQKDGTHFDLIKSPKADFDKQQMVSDGEVEITLNVPVGHEPTPDLTSIKTSGIIFDSKTGKATTTSATKFRFRGGTGSSIGASYDPTTKELHLLKKVVLDLHGKKEGSKAMRVETDELTYKETGTIIWLSPHAHLITDHSVMDAGPTLITLKDQEIDSIAAHDAHGVDTYPKRKLDYQAAMLVAHYNEDHHIDKMTGDGHPKLISESEGAVTTMTADQVNLEFTDQPPVDKPGKPAEAALTHAFGNGHAILESRQVPDPAKRQKTPESRILRSKVIEMSMRPGGKELDRVLTQSASTLEFLPNEPDQHRRVLNGDKMTIVYGKQNAIQNFNTTKVSTETYPSQMERERHAKTAKPGKPPPPPLPVSKTSSGFMTAEFDEKSQMKEMKQWENFLYDDGDRHARGTTAVLDNTKNLMDLDVKARVSDASGSTDADHIQIDQKSGNFTANGHVSTSRLPEKDKDTSSTDLLSGDQPIQGRAGRMTSADRNKVIHYDGDAILWQGSDRIQASVIDIDRNKHLLVADGKVMTQLIDKPKQDKPNKDKPKPDDAKKDEPPPAAMVFTIVRAAHMTYQDTTRLAHYTGGAVMNRPGLSVKGKEIRAYLAEKTEEGEEDTGGGSSRLDKAVTDGDVEIVDSTGKRKRTGTGSEAEYFSGDERIILHGDLALLVDSLRGTTTGKDLIYTTADDKLEVTKPAEKQTKSHLKKKVR
jgi:lipopolysaccharide export system protein LptA